MKIILTLQTTVLVLRVNGQTSQWVPLGTEGHSGAITPPGPYTINMESPYNSHGTTFSSNIFFSKP